MRAQASKLAQVEQLLRELAEERGRRERGGGAGGAKKEKRPKEGRSKGSAKGGGADEVPQVAHLDRYIEQMYEDVERATHATSMVQKLAEQAENLEGLLENEALLGLLARLLQEEGPKSPELAINVLYILYSFSNFSQFHPALYQARCGDNVLKVIDLEMRRHRVREHEKAQLGGGGTKEEEKRHRASLRKQERLLYICFLVLLNLAEEPEIERKMSKRGIVATLTTMLQRNNPDLLTLVLLFLMKLAIFKENLPALREKGDAKAAGGAGERAAKEKAPPPLPGLLVALQQFVPHQTEQLLATALRLLFNLSFDKQLVRPTSPTIRSALAARPSVAARQCRVHLWRLERASVRRAAGEREGVGGEEHGRVSG